MRRNVYKVIKKKERISAILTSKNKYSLKYLKSFETKALQGTLGIFCFKTRTDAEIFIGWHTNDKIIIRVSPIGKALRLQNISSNLTEKGLDKFYNDPKNDNFSRNKLTGTICYPSVLVLE